MKKSQSKPAHLSGKPYRFAIVLSRFNDHLGNELLKNTEDTLLKNGMLKKNLKIVRVPGALELPLAAQFLAAQKKYDAIIALGVVIKGATPHFEYVSENCYHGLMKVSLKNSLPVVFGVLTVNNEQQAKERVSKLKLNKGKEYAEAAIEMAMLAKELQ